MESYSDSPKTLIILDNIKVDKYKGPRAGFWYNIPTSFFGIFSVILPDSEYKLIKYIFTAKDEHNLNFQQFRINSDNLYLKQEEVMSFEESKLFSYIEEKGNLEHIGLIVRDTGCGNWNEIKGEEFHLIYDLGGDIKFSDSEINRVISRANLTNPYYAVISHWDLDHYRAILDMTENQLQLMQNIVVPTKMPDTLQLKNTLLRLRTLGISIEVIQPSPKIGKNIELFSQGRVNNFELFRSSDGANINKSGIVITVEGNTKIGVLPGDHHYPQIYNGVLNLGSVKPYELVVPHHGGHAGNFDLGVWNSIPFSSGALSTKSGRYKNLPKSNIHDFFITQNSFHCTECREVDYYVSL